MTLKGDIISHQIKLKNGKRDQIKIKYCFIACVFFFIDLLLSAKILSLRKFNKLI